MVFLRQNIIIVSLNKSIYYTFLTQIPTQILGIISGIFITRLLGPEGKGIYALFLADVNLFVLFFGLSINTAIVYFINSKKIEANKIAGIATLLYFIGLIGSTISIIAIYAAGLSHTFLGITDSLRTLLAFLVINIAVTLINSVFSGFLQAYKAFRSINQIAIFNSILNILFFWSLFYLHSTQTITINLLFVVIVVTGVLLLNSSFYFVVYVRKIGLKPNFNISLQNEIKPFAKYMGTGHLSQLINFLNYRLDLWVMNYYLDPAQIGFYALAAGFANLITLITLPIVNVITPTLIELNKVERMQLFKIFSQINFTMVLLAALGMFFIAPILLPFLYGAEFKPAIPLFQVLLPGIVFAASTKIFALLSIAANKLKINLYATIAGLVFTIIFDLLLIPKMGTMGASITSLITYFVIFLSLCILQQKNDILKWDNYFLITPSNIRKLKEHLYAK